VKSPCFGNAVPKTKAACATNERQFLPLEAPQRNDGA
jgi:hypothetical protein